MPNLLGHTLFQIGAEVYDLITHHDIWREHCATLADHFPKRSQPLDILDVGCGPGMSIIGVHDRHPDAHIVGVDHSSRMIQRARKRLAHLPDVELICGDAGDLPFPDASFDAITGHSFLYLVPGRERILRELHRVLRPGGRVVFLEPHENATLDAWSRLPGGSPRFLLSMVLWRIVSGQAGRFTLPTLHDTLSRDFQRVHIRPTLGGLGLLARAEKVSD